MSTSNFRSHKTGIVCRRLALDVLGERSNRFARDALHEKFAASSLGAADRRFATEIVYGVIKFSAALTQIISAYSKKIPGDPTVLNAVKMGLYQILFMDRVPSYAAVDTAVSLMNRSGKAYGNAVLRKILREARLTEGEVESACLLPVRRGVAWEFPRPLFADPAKDPCRYWATVYSYPLELVRRWQERFGAECRQLLQNGNMAPPLFLRLRAGADFANFLAQLRAQRIQYDIYQGLIQVEKCGDIALLPGFAENRWAVTGPATLSVVKSMSLQSGLKVLDLCAAPGGKTLQIADYMGGSGEILACDVSRERLRLLDDMIAKTKLSGVETVVVDGRSLPAKYRDYFDRVLVDGPCTNTAVLSKRAEARWRFSMRALADLRKIQASLLESGAQALKPGGILVYSTCSLEPEENEEVVGDFLRRHREFECVTRQRILPVAPHLDGASFFQLVKGRACSNASRKD